ncbi:hypothetical protein FSP39_004040 [Pinctada imbricata]|uniref:SWIM-type domain-containing protein n=1 Tax=Pinctada imbricata TaxID=66713 RepID=A0AA89BR83_PINIB|nr:hypothetical protein FSP39_004040 [Pinctada imbricata]
MIADGVPQTSRVIIINDLYNLLRSNSQAEYNAKLEQISTQWPPDFRKYFLDSINPKAEHFGMWRIQNKFRNYITEYGVTTNQSEGFNWLLHDIQGWKEAPIDCVMLGFKMLQSYYLNEIRRGKSGLGNYTLRPQYHDMLEDLETSMPNTSCHPNDIVQSIKEKKVILKSPQEQQTPGDNSRVVRAQEIRLKDGISLSSRLGVFTVFDERNFNIVKLFPPSCSCPLKDGCVHILAVKLSLNMPISDDTGIRNLSTVRKNARAPKKVKPGRKKPRHGDDDLPEQTEQCKERVEYHTERAEHHTEQAANQTEQQTEQEDPQTEQTEQQTEQAEQQTEQTEQQTEQTEQQTEQTEQQTEQANESIQKDILYSQEVWVCADGSLIRENLNVSDRRLITDPCGWLNCTIIDACMDLIKSQFTNISGLESSCLGIQLDFTRHTDDFIQIINRNPTNGGTHWLTVSNIGCTPGTVNICDSSFSDVPSIELQCIATLVQPPSMELKIHMLDVFPQNNGYDCGLYAIANLVTIASGHDPTKMRYDRRKMRSHLFLCLERKSLTMFPTIGQRKVKNPVKREIVVQLHCYCKLPETHTLYVMCDGCDGYFHPQCLGMTDDQATAMDNVYCHECSIKYK